MQTHKSIALIAESLRCPDCAAPLDHDDRRLQCRSCGAGFPVVDQCVRFLPAGDARPATDDLQYRLKQWVKRFPFLYRLFLFLFSPVYAPPGWMTARMPEVEEGNITLHIGSGPSVISPLAWNIDMQPYPNVDMTCDALRLPFADETVDMVVSIVMLEHVPDPTGIVAEMRRVLKPGGTVFTIVPFLQCYHDSPHDYYRWTLPGLDLLHSGFSRKASGALAGPASALCWTAQETAATLFSLGIPSLYKVLQLFFMVLFSPIKFLDLLLVHFPSAPNAASTLYYHGTKNDPPAPEARP